MLEIRPATTDRDLEHLARIVNTVTPDIDNAPMRAVNRKLGYQPRPDELDFRGPLWSPTQSAQALKA